MDDPKKLLQEANGYLRNAQNNMFSGKNTEAVELLNKADDLGQKAKQLLPDDFQVNSLLQKVEKMRKDLERKGIQTRPGGNNELPFEVQAQLNRVRDHVVNKELEWAKRELDNYYSRFAGPMTDIPEIKEIKEHIEKLEAEAAIQSRQKAEEEKANAESNANAQELSREWEAKLRSIPYFDGAAHNVPALLEHKQSYSKALPVIEEYATIDFKGQQSITLESMARDIKSRIDTFKGNLTQTITAMATEIVGSIDDRIDFLNLDTAWKNDPDQKPYVVGKNEMEAFQLRIDELRPLYDDNRGAMESMNNAMSKLSDMNAKRKEELAKRVTMKPEVITGSDAHEPVDAAMSALSKAYPGFQPIKIAVTRQWENKRIEQWADNTRSQWIVKNISETTVQIAAELEGSVCKLFTMHVEKNKNSDGTFGAISSHIMFEDEAVSSNFM
jgi:hypothetical protein